MKKFFKSIHISSLSVVDPIWWCLTNFMACFWLVFLIAVDALLCRGLVLNDVIRLLVLIIELCSRNVWRHASTNEVIGQICLGYVPFTQRKWSLQQLSGRWGLSENNFKISILQVFSATVAINLVWWIEPWSDEALFYKANVLPLASLGCLCIFSLLDIGLNLKTVYMFPSL